MKNFLLILFGQLLGYSAKANVVDNEPSIAKVNDSLRM